MQRYASRHRVLPPSLRSGGFPRPFHHRFLTRSQRPPIWIAASLIALLVFVAILTIRW
jgi:hypothetical protein